MIHKYPDSRITFDGIERGQQAVAAAALEKVAERLDEQKQEGAAELLRRFGCALCEQIMAGMEDERRGQ